MARSDLLLSLVKAGVQGDRSLFQRTVDAIIAEERAKQHNVFADQLDDVVRKSEKIAAPPPPIMNGAYHSLLHETQPGKSLSDLVLLPQIRLVCDELIEEQLRADLLRAHNIEPRHRILLIGPPGNGKTCLAEAIAQSLGLTLFSVRYEGVVGSYLGETAGRLQKLFEHVSTRPCVLFFDEFDTLGKERGDVHDTGEIKRVVSSLLLQIDRLPSYVIVVAATNHQELLDRAVWRRFQIRLELPPPTVSQVANWFQLAAERWKLPARISPNTLAKRIRFESFAELEDFTLDLIRCIVLAQDQKDATSILSERIEQWRVRARRKAR
ncbi:MAG: AAA family ATPase [Nitrospirota bacterium]|nr:AAA family ATPase [Nitrospirota bacterium]MDE3244002.1 AAA family ATPase [Nitrospirota bacterium]